MVGRYNLDFSQLTVGTGLPAGFTWLRNPGTEVIDVQESIDYLDGKALRVRSTDINDWRALGIDAVSIPASTDFDIVWRVMNVATEGDHIWAEGVFARFDPAAGTSGRYAGGFGYDNAAEGRPESLVIGRSGETTSNWYYMGGTDFASPNRNGNNTWHWFRYRSVGDRYKLVCSTNQADIELDVNGEPVVGWDIDEADPWQPTVDSSVGFAFWRRSNLADQIYDYFEAAWGAENYASTTATATEIDLSLVDKTDTTVDLAWTDTETWDEYQVERDGVVIDTVPGTQFTYTDSGLSSSTTYDYRVRGGSASVGIVATGGTVTDDGGYRYHTFTTSDDFVVTAGGDVEYLVVAGGGGGGRAIGGGGGGGAALTNVGGTALAVTAQTYSVVVGGGGPGGTGDETDGTNGSPGSDSSALGISASGGAGGAWRNEGTAPSGGTGGGAGRASPYEGGTGDPGGDGGDGFPSTAVEDGACGGGGGATGNGETGDTKGGDGGSGLTSSISGSSVSYGGGGGGGADGRGGKEPGLGVDGGADGTSDNATPTTATANLGGGGGGSGFESDNSKPAGAGGSGIVIIRYVL